MKFIKRFISSLENLVKRPIFRDPNFLAILWLGTALVGNLTRIHKGATNNYLIFSHSFWHALTQQPLYAAYPAEHNDLFLYGIPFTAIIAPFAMLPDIIGVILWCLANSLFLFMAVKHLQLEKWKFAFVIWISINELFPPILAAQYNIGIAGMIIFSFALIEKNKEFWAALMIMLGAMTKIYGIVGLAFFLFSKRKLHLLKGMLFWGLIIFLVPMLYTSPQYVIEAYREWLQVLLYKNDLNTFCSYTNISLLGMVRKISGSAAYSDLWIIIPGLILFAAPYFRIKQYENKSFRLLYLSSALLFMVLFSTGTESCGYISAMIAAGIWYVYTPTRHRTPVLNTSLLVFCFILTSLSPTDIFPRWIRITYIVPYSLKALPCVLIWLKIVWEQLTQDFSGHRPPLSEHKIDSIDIVLPCYNPQKNWEQIVINKYSELKAALAINIRLIVVNDGSVKGFTPDAVQRLLTALPDMVIVDNPKNKGKGAAVRAGLVHSDSEFILYTDYDFPYETQSICEVVQLLEKGYDVVIASRNHTYYSHLSFKRKIMSHASQILNFCLLGLTHSDTQGGLKGFNKKGKKYLALTHVNRFLFDTEFIYQASKDNDIRIAEIEVNLRNNIMLPNMKKKVLKEELKNLWSIAWRG